MKHYRVESLERRRLLTSIVYVDPAAPGPIHDGGSWATAFQDLQQALVPAVAGTSVRVADGIYRPTSGSQRFATFALKSGVALEGGYAGHGSPNPDQRDFTNYLSILSGDIGATGVNTDNSEHVLTADGTDSTATLDGFVVSDGFSLDGGSGLLCTAGSFTILNCVFEDNAGAIKSLRGSSLATITRCTFQRNSTAASIIYDGNGGAISINDSAASISDCVFADNSAQSEGGAVFISAASATIQDCVFRSNSSKVGGAINLHGGLEPSDRSDVKMVNCTLTANTASSGGAIECSHSSIALTNCTLIANVAASFGGAIRCSQGDFTLTNCIVRNNRAILGPQVYIYDYPTSITHSDIEGGWDGAGNIDADPLFFDADGIDNLMGTADDDLRLRSVSPAADAGTNSAPGLVGIGNDLLGGPRFLSNVPHASPIVDMGAYESAPIGIDISAGGPYQVIEGQTVSVTAHGTSDAAGALNYAWDLDGDGQFDDAAGASTVFSAEGLLPQQTRMVGVQFTDSLGRTVSDVASVSILPKILYVDDSATGANTGVNWSDALVSLQAALQVAIPGSEIRVAQGVYLPGSTRLERFNLKEGVSILGGYAGEGTPNPNARDVAKNVTILSGDIGVRGDSADNSYGILMAYRVDATAILDGFTVTGGNADLGSLSIGTFAGGLWLDNANPTIRNCIFMRNSANYGGGALVISYRSNPIVTNCQFLGNHAGRFGGAVYIFRSSTVEMTNCIFVGNTSDYLGGAIYNSAASVTMRNCTSSANGPDENEFVLPYAGATLNIVNSILHGYAPIYAPGGGVTVSYSVADGWDGAGNTSEFAYFLRWPAAGADEEWGTTDDDYGDLRLRNDSAGIDAGSNAAIASESSTDLAGNPRVADVVGINDPGATVDMGAFEHDPTGYLVDAPAPKICLAFPYYIAAQSLTVDDLRLQNISTGQFIDVGSLATLSFDDATSSGTWQFTAALPDGNYRARICGSSIATIDGFPFSKDIIVDFFILSGDANHDRKIDANDLAILSANWQGTSKTFSQGDFNSDGKVDIQDLYTLTSKWQQALPPPAPSAAPVATTPPRRTPVRVATSVLA